MASKAANATILQSPERGRSPGADRRHQLVGYRACQWMHVKTDR